MTERIEDSLVWLTTLRQLGFVQKSDEEAHKKGSHYIMTKDGFEVEYSTCGLWENERIEQSSITSLSDLAFRYNEKTREHLLIK